MPDAVYRMMRLLCTLVAPLPVGTTLGVPHLLWMLMSGQVLAARGAVIPGLTLRFNPKGRRAPAADAGVGR